MNLSLEEIQSVLAEKVDNSAVIASIIKDLEKIILEKKEDKDDNKEPKRKNAFAIVVVDSGSGLDFGTGFVVKYKQDGDDNAILAKLSEAARAFNETSRGAKAPLTSMIEVFGHLKPKFLKAINAELSIQTKEAVRVLISNNKLV